MFESRTIRTIIRVTVFRQMGVQHVFRIKCSLTVHLGTDGTFEKQNVSAS